MAGLLDSPYGGGGLLGNPMQAGLLNSMGNPSAGYFPTRYAVPGQPNMTDRVVGGMVRLPFAMAEGIGNTVMQANRAMPWGGNDPSAIGIDPQAGTMDPGVMVPFATNVAGMATTGSLAVPPVAGGVGMGIRAYHGSPHDFDRFSMDKIGTGEGAQAYGHGLYFAENQGTAKAYQDALAHKAQAIDVNGERISPTGRMGTLPAKERAAVMLRMAIDDGTGPLGALMRARNALRRAEAGDITEFQREGGWGDTDVLRDVVKQLEDWQDKDVKPVPGRMYEVDIDASPDEFIDYDAPWEAQPPAVKKHFSHLAKKGTGPDGSDLARRIESQVFLEEARAAGIKGIRYKDAGSRATSGGELLGVDRGADGWKAKVRVTNRTGVGIQAPADMVTTSKAFPTEAEARQWAESKIGGGTSNYVVFDENTINILKKYGLAGLTAGGAGAAMLGGSQDASAMPMPSYATGGRF